MKVKLIIFKGQHLPVRDEKLGSSDPYIKIKVPIEGTEEKFKKVGKTKTIKQVRPRNTTHFRFQN